MPMGVSFWFLASNGSGRKRHEGVYRVLKIGATEGFNVVVVHVMLHLDCVTKIRMTNAIASPRTVVPQYELA